MYEQAVSSCCFVALAAATVTATPGGIIVTWNVAGSNEDFISAEQSSK
jgi:hypothetical protein